MSTRELPMTGLDTQRLAGLVFEVASQLHAERLHRMALETALERAGVLQREAIAAIAGDPEFRRLGEAAVEESLAKLMRVITELADARRPLRDRDA